MTAPIEWADDGPAAVRHVAAGAEGAPLFWSSRTLTMMGGAFAIIVLGLVDDAVQLRGRWKLLGLACVAGAMYWGGFQIHGISNPLFGSLPLGPFAAPITLLWFLGCMNCLNLVDGLDGLAAGVTLFAAAALAVTAALLGNGASTLIFLALAGTTLGFLVFNFRPASIYLGDTGSLLLGFLIACQSITASQKSYAGVALLAPLCALGIPVFDTALAIVRRWLKGLPLAAPDRQHLHHKLLEFGFTHRRAVLLVYASTAVLGIAGVVLAIGNNMVAGFTLIGLVLATVTFGRRAARHEIRLFKDLLDRLLWRRKRWRRCREATYKATTKLRHVDNVDEMWDIVTDAAEHLEIDEAEMSLHNGLADGKLTWEAAQEEAASADEPGVESHWSVELPLSFNGQDYGKLRCIQKYRGEPKQNIPPELLGMLRRALTFNIGRLCGDLSELKESRWKNGNK